MLSRFILGGALLLSAGALAASPELYRTCKSKVTNMSYGSEKWELACSEEYDMPDPYLIKCAVFVKNGFPTSKEEFAKSVDKIACQTYCRNNNNWGPWFDYEISFELKDIVLEMKNRHGNGRCMEN